MSAPPLLQKTGLLLDEDGDVDTETDTNEGTSAGHHYLQQQRQVLKVMRLIEHDMPKLVLLHQYDCKIVILHQLGHCPTSPT